MIWLNKKVDLNLKIVLILTTEFISNKNLENYCCICTTKELVDYEYFTLFQVSEKGTEAIFIKDSGKIVGELIYKINKNAIQILLLFSKNSKRSWYFCYENT